MELTDKYRRGGTVLKQVTDAKMVPHCVNIKLGHIGLNLLELCRGCEPLFTVEDEDKNHVPKVCAGCGKTLAINDTKIRAIPGSYTAFQLRKFAAKGDYFHDRCHKRAGRMQPQPTKQKAKKRKATKPTSVYNIDGEVIDISVTKDVVISDRLKLLASYVVGCLSKQKKSEPFQLPVYRKQCGGTPITVALIPAQRSGSPSQRTTERARSAVLGVAEAVVKNSPLRQASDVIKDVGLHSKEGQAAGLGCVADQQVVNVEEMQIDVDLSGRKSIALMSKLRVKGVKCNLTVRDIQQRKVDRRLDMSFQKEKVFHTKHGASQSIYVKRSRDMCDVLADRISQLMPSESFVALDGLAQGKLGDFYFSLSVRFFCLKIFFLTQHATTPHTTGLAAVTSHHTHTLYSTIQEGDL